MTRRSRLLIDLSAAYNQGAGIGRYARGVVGSAWPSLKQDFDVSGWHAPDPGSAGQFEALAEYALGEAATTVRRAPISRRRIDQLWFRTPLAITARVLVPAVDVVYSPDFTAPPVPRARSVVTVHDLAFLTTPDYCPEPLRRYLTGVVPRQLARAARIAVVSEATRDDVVRACAVEPSRITVIPNAADERFFVATAPAPPDREGLGLPARYLLTVGTLEPRKNHLTIFEAMERVHAQTGVAVVVVGRDGWSNGRIRARMRELTERGVVVDLTNLDDDLLPAVYAGAAGVIQMSWHEGFGIPVVEALAAGAPVIASDIAAHREVAGGAARLVPPSDVDGLAHAIAELLGRDRRHDADAGRRAARAYSWSRSATMLVDLLSEVRDGRDPG